MDVLQFAHPKLMFVWFLLLLKMLAIAFALKAVILLTPQDRKVSPNAIVGL